MIEDATAGIAFPNIETEVTECEDVAISEGQLLEACEVDTSVHLVFVDIDILYLLRCDIENSHL